MSYEQACADLYNERLDKQRRLQVARDKFRQQVLDRQNGKEVRNYVPIKYSADKANLVIDYSFVMPDSLPDNEGKLKWLIFQNIELIQKVPERKAEGQLNIKRIKAFINEQKAKQGL